MGLLFNKVFTLLHTKRRRWGGFAHPKINSDIFHDIPALPSIILGPNTLVFVAACVNAPFAACRLRAILHVYRDTIAVKVLAIAYAVPFADGCVAAQQIRDLLCRQFYLLRGSYVRKEEQRASCEDAAHERGRSFFGS